MRYLLIACLVLFVAAVGLSAANGLVDRLREPSYAEIVADQVKADQLRRQNELDEKYAPVRAAVLHGALILVVLGGLAYAGGLAAAHVKRTHLERMPNDAGLLPVLASDQATARAVLAAYHQTRQIAAAIAPVPVNYSPHITYAPHHELEMKHDAPRLLPGDVTAPALPALPGITDLADLSFRPSVERILLGLGEGGEPITVPMRSLWHIALAGPTGNGKSSIARMVVAQLQAIGAQVCIGDPKWTEFDAEQDEDWRPIARRLAREPAYEARSISALLRWIAEPGKGELARRLDLRRRGEKPGSPVFIYLDELPWIAVHVKDAAAMIGELVRVGRGVGLFLLVGTQDMLAKTVDLSAERDNFRTGYYLGGDQTTGAVLLGIPRRDVVDPDGVGLAWLRSTATTPPRQVRIPYASNRAIYGLLGDGAPTSRPTSTTPSPLTSGGLGEFAREVGREVGLEVRPEAGASGIRTPQTADQTAAARDRHILRLIRERRSVSEIVEEVWGVRGGSKFSEYSREVMRVAAENLRGDE